MTLISRALVIVAVLVVSTAATPPPGYVRKPDNDEHPPSYEYKYDIEDEAREDRHGKTETRDGEHASGRYYVSSRGSSTDVKYVADEWGYHPLVKYGSANEHSRTSASLALGEKAVQSSKETIALSTVTPNNDNTFPASEDRVRAAQVVHPYRTEGGNAINEEAPTGVPLFFPVNIDAARQTLHLSHPSIHEQYFAPDEGTYQSTIIREQTDLVSSNELRSTEEEEGESFGHRLPPQPGQAAETATPRAPRVSPKQLERTYLPVASTAALPVTSVTGNSIITDEPSPPDGKELAFGARPIVVPEQRHQPEEPSFRYSTTFKCADEEAPSTAGPPLSSSDATSSSRVLNSIQAGVALVNAGAENLLLDKAPAPVNERVEDIPQSEQPPVTPSSGAAESSDYQPVNPAFGGQTSPEPPVLVQKAIQVYQNTSRQRILAQAVQSSGQLNQPIKLVESNGSSSSLERHEQAVPEEPSRQLYVVPPATYILDGNSVLKNGLLQDKAALYYGPPGNDSPYQQNPSFVLPKAYTRNENKPMARPVLYPVRIEKTSERKVVIPYAYAGALGYQQLAKPQNRGLYPGSLYPLVPHGPSNVNKSRGYAYEKPSLGFHEGKQHLYPPATSYYLQQQSANSLLRRRHASVVLGKYQQQRDEYYGPVPMPHHHVHRQFGFQAKSFGPYAGPVDLRQARAKGSFRQSKMEYGFKPPMVPSVQYDEGTASRVDS